MEINVIMNYSFFKDSKVLITGNTGFKGCWLTLWLKQLGAEVVGVSIDIPTKPAMYEATNMSNQIKQYYCDINNHDEFKSIVAQEQPDFVFHLAAQPIVSLSYDDPLGTIRTNSLGSISVLKALECIKGNCVVIMITSDKCYENVEWEWGYKETDRLGGKDIYSASKGAAELLISSFVRSFMSNQTNISVGIGRAGNVIGGGDWASNRLIVDIVKKWSVGQNVEVRNPLSVRPWQHVLEPLSGYLQLAKKLSENHDYHGEAFNFGPRPDVSHTVEEIVNIMQGYWFGTDDKKQYWNVKSQSKIFEAGLLKLNCEKAGAHLDWFPKLEIEHALQMVVQWYKSYYQEATNINHLSLEQIQVYQDL